MTYLLALDQGTSSSRSIVFNAEGQMVASAQREFTQHYPRPGWVEHDPWELWQSQRDTAREALAKAGIRAKDVAAMGIANQRETTLLWNRSTGEPLYRAIVWQDRRGHELCEAMRQAGLETEIQARTGLRLDPYFSASKIAWLLETVPGARAAAERGQLAFGTVDTWLAWQLTQGRCHVTDITNASRTLLWNLHTASWDEWLLEQFRIPREILPEVHPSGHLYGEVATEVLDGPVLLAAMAGDQQAALFGQACFTPGSVKNTYGTGCFMLRHAGATPSPAGNGLLATAAASAVLPASGSDTNPQNPSSLTAPGPSQNSTTSGGVAPAYALEGSVFVGGAVVQWLRDNLNAIRTSADVQDLAATVPDAGGVFFVPAFTGLGAPYWRPTATGTITGLTRGTTMGHIARAALESIAFQSAALLRAMGGIHTHGVLKVDGGASANDLLMQFQADLLGLPVVRPKVLETTALGAAYLAGLSCGVFRNTEEVSQLWEAGRTFVPTLPRAQAETRMAEWEATVERSCPPVES